MATEYAVSRMDVTGVSGEFTTALDASGSRKLMILYNASHTNSGELYLGQAQMGASSKFAIPKDVFIELPLTDNLSTYFEAEAGEKGVLFIMEIA